MADKSNYAQNRTLNYLLGISPSATVYLGLLTAAGTDSSAGTEVNSGTETNYARQAVAWDAPALSGGLYQTANSNALTFGVAVAGYTVVQEAVYDALTGGNRLYYKTVTNQAVAVGNAYHRPVGSIVVREN
jgi:hypothetical protein